MFWFREKEKEESLDDRYKKYVTYVSKRVEKAHNDKKINNIIGQKIAPYISAAVLLFILYQMFYQIFGFMVMAPMTTVIEYLPIPGLESLLNGAILSSQAALTNHIKNFIENNLSSETSEYIKEINYRVGLIIGSLIERMANVREEIKAVYNSSNDYLTKINLIASKIGHYIPQANEYVEKSLINAENEEDILFKYLNGFDKKTFNRLKSDIQKELSVEYEITLSFKKEYKVSKKGDLILEYIDQKWLECYRPYRLVGVKKMSKKEILDALLKYEILNEVVLLLWWCVSGVPQEVKNYVYLNYPNLKNRINVSTGSSKIFSDFFKTSNLDKIM